MPISSLTRTALIGLALALPFAAAQGFDGSRSTSVPSLPSAGLVAPGALSSGGGSAAAAAPVQSPMEAFRSGTSALKAGESAKAVTALQYAAEQGMPLAQWKLGRMYADGDGVPRDKLRAFEYFSRIADAHADDTPNTPQARIVSNAFVQVGLYYLEGIPNTDVRADPVKAREMFAYAASYFGDADAQYNLARLYLDGGPSPVDSRQALRWLSLSANKGHHRAQAMLGSILFKGAVVQRQAARGLMWLTLARDGAGANEAWIVDLHNAASKQATDDEQQLALAYLERWIKGAPPNSK